MHLRVSIVLLVVFLFNSCKREPEFEILEEVTFSVISSENELNSVQFESQNIIEYSIDGGGVYTFQDLKSNSMITPKLYGYGFDPSVVMIQKGVTNYEIVATKIETLKSDSVYNWLKHIQLKNGLLPSTESGNLISLYDNALAAFAFMSYGDWNRAEGVLDYFDQLVGDFTPISGGFSQFRDTLGNANGHKWLGDNAWLLMAYRYYNLEKPGKYSLVIQKLEEWIENQLDENGLGVFGGYDANGNRIGKITEGNIDAYLAVSGYTDFHENVAEFFKKHCYDSLTQSLIIYPHSISHGFALDLHAWGYCGFKGLTPKTLTVAEEKMKLTVQTTQTGNTVTGFCFDQDKDAYWCEGTGQMIVAFWKANEFDKVNFYLSELEKTMFQSAQFNDAISVPYAANQGTGYGYGQLWEGVDTKPAVSGATWYLFAKNYFDPLALFYQEKPAIEF